MDLIALYLKVGITTGISLMIFITSLIAFEHIRSFIYLAVLNKDFKMTALSNKLCIESHRIPDSYFAWFIYSLITIFIYPLLIPLIIVGLISD